MSRSMMNLRSAIAISFARQARSVAVPRWKQRCRERGNSR
jgi:hypothetical protein